MVKTSSTFVTKIGWIVETGEVKRNTTIYVLIIPYSISFFFFQKTHVDLIDVVKSFPTILHSNEYSLAKIDFDAAENESLIVCQALES